jgi:hypothetical protein
MDTGRSRAAESVDSSRPRDHFAAVWDAFVNQIFLPWLKADALTFDKQRVAAFHDNHILIIVVNMLG